MSTREAGRALSVHRVGPDVLVDAVPAGMQGTDVKGHGWTRSLPLWAGGDPQASWIRSPPSCVSFDCFLGRREAPLLRRNCVSLCLQLRVYNRSLVHTRSLETSGMGEMGEPFPHRTLYCFIVRLQVLGGTREAENTCRTLPRSCTV